MTRRTLGRVAIAVLTAVALAVFTAVATAGRAHAEPVTFCVEDSTGMAGAVRAAVAAFDDAPEVRLTYRRSPGCLPTAVYVTVTDSTAPAGMPGAWIEPAGGGREFAIRLNRDAGLTARQWRAGVLHELTHAVLFALDPGYRGEHVHRCDSVLSDNLGCVLAHDQLTRHDRQLIAAAARQDHG